MPKNSKATCRRSLSHFLSFVLALLEWRQLFKFNSRKSIHLTISAIVIIVDLENDLRINVVICLILIVAGCWAFFQFDVVFL